MAQKTVVLDVVGLTRELISTENTPFLAEYTRSDRTHTADVEPAFPALTCVCHSHDFRVAVVSVVSAACLLLPPKLGGSTFGQSSAHLNTSANSCCVSHERSLLSGTAQSTYSAFSSLNLNVILCSMFVCLPVLAREHVRVLEARLYVSKLPSCQA
jgi:hypothetical protein